jgi:LDH2 family malate/lactate/ureidoglycolate dehydrogenase
LQAVDPAENHTTVLTGFTLSDETWGKYLAARLGGMVLAIDIETVVSPTVFGAEADRLARDIRSYYKPMPGNDEALLPGVVEEQIFALHRAEGIRYGEMEQENARAASALLGVPLPWQE